MAGFMFLTPPFASIKQFRQTDKFKTS